MMRRSVAVVLGLVLVLGGGLAALSGGAVLALFGSDSKVTSNPEHLSTTTRALVTDIGEIEGARGFGSIFGDPRLHISVADQAHGVFIGIGPAAAVDRYLSGAAVDKVTDFGLEPFHLDTTHHDGSATPQRPDSQTFWVSHNNGPRGELDWRITDGSYRLVVMNADGAAGVDLNARLGLTIPHLYGIGTGVLIGGLAIAVVGVVLFITGLQMPNGRQQHRQPILFTAGTDVR
jgi:hypothetical protein